MVIELGEGMCVAADELEGQPSMFGVEPVDMLAIGLVGALQIDGDTADAFTQLSVEKRVDLTALFRTEGIIEAIVETCRDWLSEQLDKYDVAIQNAGEEARHAFDAHRAQSGRPEPTPVLLPKQVRAVTVTANGTKVPTTGGHLYADADGQFPVPQGSSWEADVLATEQARGDFAGWYRNPPSGAASISIPYERHDGWTAVHPDFVIFTRTGDDKLVASIVDPHDPSRGDALPKLKAFASYAAEHGDAYLRIESVVKVGDDYRKLSMKDEAVRIAVLAASGAQGAALALFSSSESKSYS